MTVGGAAFVVVPPLKNTWELFFVKGSLASVWWMKEVEKLMQMFF